MARLDDIDIDIRNAVLRANATDREEIARILRYLYRLSEKLKWWQTKLDRGNLTEEERKTYEGLITGAEEIRQELDGKVDSDQMADATHNGLLSVLDWPKLQFNMIPKYTDMDYYAFNMGFHYASSAVAMTLTNYPTSDDSVMLCIGEPDYQYQIVIEVDRNTPKIYGRPVYFMEPWTAWKQLHWFDTATASSDGLMSAADKKRLDELEVGGRNLLLYSAEPIVYSAYSTINVTRNISVPEWGATDATRVVGSGGSNLYVCRVGGNTEDMAYGKNVGVNGKNYTISVWIKNNHATNRCGVRINLPYDPGYTMLNPGESMRVEQTAVGNGSTVLCIYFRTGNLGEDFDFTIWHPKIEEGTFATDWTPAVEEYAGEASVTFDSIRNTSNTSGGAGTLRRIGKTVNLYFSTTLTNALTASTWLTIGTLPVGYRPKESIYTQGSTIDGTLVRVYLGSLGGIQVWCPAALSGGTLVHGVLTWFVA